MGKQYPLFSFYSYPPNLWGRFLLWPLVGDWLVLKTPYLMATELGSTTACRLAVANPYRYGGTSLKKTKRSIYYSYKQVQALPFTGIGQTLKIL